MFSLKFKSKTVSIACTLICTHRSLSVLLPVRYVCYVPVYVVLCRAGGIRIEGALCVHGHFLKHNQGLYYCLASQDFQTFRRLCNGWVRASTLLLCMFERSAFVVLRMQLECYLYTHQYRKKRPNFEGLLMHAVRFLEKILGLDLLVSSFDCTWLLINTIFGLIQIHVQ